LLCCGQPVDLRHLQTPRDSRLSRCWDCRVVVYCMRRVGCEDCGVTVRKCRAEGKHTACNAYRLFLAMGASVVLERGRRHLRHQLGVVYRAIPGWSTTAWPIAASTVSSHCVDEIAVWAGHKYLHRRLPDRRRRAPSAVVGKETHRAEFSRLLRSFRKPDQGFALRGHDMWNT